ncbi:DUF4142 domain-containing protein [Xanthomonas rydalmerensis]|uniref:DUF4142 domain-containing protein n=1 Tax=Xanthomonas rydalmerensis TaxID=3046274 RepID=A0ABZ0JL26_9XANT|nr:DUF4142 domain-containing protein [Xanthomonas sp. DM-2023]WOS39708.1 DUF4142 domain-containing protein [Xanthomonas sp. DM-2023]WOS43892.1 DUF4142 domain-containing protein [Xanthomonas sp. DM-2023]WOS48072.1 DUF4142 domain-containing protein [Xanthomonas sp. DM-2023]WOS52251.1 DUF4142 domain-containing protein [Xanthomonas sp. DM-2023]WOS56435.1 DUF4142 domain-containing protein [Xanthomonas sp. DM-2023]
MRPSRSVLSLALVSVFGIGLAHAQTDTSGQAGTRDPGAMQQNAPSTTASPASTSMQGARTAALNEKQALGVLSAINTSEVNAANLALQKQVKGPVRDYAMQMVKEHSDNNAKIAPWGPDTKAAPAQQQMKKAKAEAGKLQALDGDRFEQAYVAAMVKDHQAALQMLDSTLIPAAKTPEVAAHLRTTRTHVAEHLAKAQQLQSAGATPAGSSR